MNKEPGINLWWMIEIVLLFMLFRVVLDPSNLLPIGTRDCFPGDKEARTRN
jgi:hypothetical protein